MMSNNLRSLLLLVERIQRICSTNRDKGVRNKRFALSRVSTEPAESAKRAQSANLRYIVQQLKLMILINCVQSADCANFVNCVFVYTRARFGNALSFEKEKKMTRNAQKKSMRARKLASIKLEPTFKALLYNLRSCGYISISFSL